MFVRVAIVLVMMRVAQNRQLLEQEEAEQAGQERSKQRARVGLRFKRLGQGVQERGREQNADREADHTLNHLGQERERKHGGSRDADDTGNGRGEQDGNQRGVNGFPDQKLLQNMELYKSIAPDHLC